MSQKYKLIAGLLLIAGIGFAIMAVLGLAMESIRLDPSEIVYKKDKRTGICYAYGPKDSLARVTCTPRVEAILEN